jgi:hypothetical protein
MRTYIIKRVLQLGETVHGGLYSAIWVLKKGCDNGSADYIVLWLA